MTTMNPASHPAQPSADPVMDGLKGLSKAIRDAYGGQGQSLNAKPGAAGQAWEKTKSIGYKATEALQALIRAVTQLLLRVLNGIRGLADSLLRPDDEKKNKENKDAPSANKQDFAPSGGQERPDGGAELAGRAPEDVNWEIDSGEEDVDDVDLKNFTPAPAMPWDPVDAQIVEEEVERMREAHKLGRATLLGRATPLLPANKETAAVETEAMKYMTDKITGHFKDPVTSNKLLEAISKAKSEAEVQEIVAKEVFGPTIEEIAKEGDHIRSKLQSDLAEQLEKEGPPVEGFDLHEASRTIVEGLPQNLSKEVLPLEKSQVVEEFLRSRATDIRSVLQINAIAGVQSNIFDGTFDFLNRAQANKTDPTIMTPESFKLHGKKDHQEQADVHNTAMRPRL